MSQVSQNLNDLSSLEGHWSLDPEKTTVEFHTKIMRVVPVTGSIKATEGGATVGADGTIDGVLILDAATIDTGIKKRDGHLLTADFFDADNFPTIVFTAQSARRRHSGQHEIAGNLALHGKTRPLTIVAAVHHGATEATVSATNIDVDRTAWGVGRKRLGQSITSRIVVNAHFFRD
ncbi:MAG TPA: YceI family protein [Acidimicrobiales bacterium]